MSTEYLSNCINMLKRAYTKEQLKDSRLFKGLSGDIH